MQALARNLSDRDIDDIAAYYDSLPKARTAPARYDETSAPALVRVGDPLRNIAPCIACHGGIDHKLGAPWLEGMPKDYLRRAAQGLRIGRAAQRQPCADAQHGARDDGSRDRAGRGFLCATSEGRRWQVTRSSARGSAHITYG